MNLISKIPAKYKGLFGSFKKIIFEGELRKNSIF